MPRRRTGVRKSRIEKKDIEHIGKQESEYKVLSERMPCDTSEMDMSKEISSQSSVKNNVRKKKTTGKGKGRFVLVTFVMLLTAGVIGIGIGKLLSLIF